MNRADSTPLAAGGNGRNLEVSRYRTCGRRRAHEFNARAARLRIRKHKPSAVLNWWVKVLINALIQPPAMNSTAATAEAAAPALSGNRLMALELEMGRVMVVPAVQSSMGTNTVGVDKPNR